MFDFKIVTEWLHSTLLGIMPEWATILTESVLVAIVIIALYAVLAIVLIYMERKVCAFFQCRLGPNRVGKWGLLQVFCDVFKMLTKEIINLRNKISPETKLIINGDIKTKAQALKLHDKYPEIDGFMIGRGIFENPYCFTDHTSTKAELMELLKLHLDLYDERTKQVLRNLSELRRDRRGAAPVTTGGRDPVSEKLRLVRSSYEPLKHFFKIYINNFPGAKDLRAKLMETHSVDEAKKVIQNY